ncbi:membrane protein [Oceaniferula spumae]|uniref:Membrane protein n=1 Tax=Oceaniferula spumae TaxID=2979115 RepID=A0AAT9FGC7_9BACT
MKTIVKIIVPLAIIGGAFLLGKFIVGTKEERKSQKPQPVIPQVDLATVPLADHQPPVLSYGTVQSYFETTLTPQVTGQIVEVSPKFRVGEMVKKGDLLARLDDTDYQSALATQQANLELQKRTLAEEEILAKQASEDWLASGRKLSSASEFVLRKPQMATAKANISSAEASIQKATADIERTRITAPYDAVVTERTASLGNLATAQTSLGTLVATERAEVRLPLTADQFARIEIPSKSEIDLTSPNKPGVVWKATLKRTEPTVDPQNQVIYIIAEVKNPYTVGEQTLAVGTFVNASIPATTIDNAYRVPEAALVNDAYLWIVDAENKLVKADAERVYSHNAHAYVRLSSQDIKPPLKVVTRPLSNFREGTTVQAADDTAKK